MGRSQAGYLQIRHFTVLPETWRIGLSTRQAITHPTSLCSSIVASVALTHECPRRCHLGVSIIYHFRSHLKNARIVRLDIRDNYEFARPELVALLESKVGRHLAA